MNQQENQPYYIDFARSGGVVESKPTTMLPELVFTGKIKSKLENELEQHAKMVQETLGESARKGLGLRRTTGAIRPIFLDLSLPLPGLTELKDNFYTGWFYTAEAGQRYSAFRKRDDVSFSQYVLLSRREPYFLLDKTEAALWDERVKQEPLTVEQIDELFLSPSIDVHPSYESLSRSNLKELTDTVTATADSFWTTFHTSVVMTRALTSVNS